MYTNENLEIENIDNILCTNVTTAFQFYLFCSWKESRNINTVHDDPEFLPSSQLTINVVKVR